jgi:hypothetical protein
MAKRTSSKRARKPTRRATSRRPRRAQAARRPTRRPAAKTRARTAKAKPRPPKRQVAKATRKASRPAAPKPVPKPAPKSASKRTSPPARPKAVPHELHPPTLARQRRQLPDAERAPNEPTVDSRLVGEARAGHDALARSLRSHTETSPVLTAGDVDAKWEDAYAVGDEAPGGDNPTPDQNEVDEIGRALGTEYADGEELMGGDEIEERDEHRWELDPKSREDEPDED